MTTSLPPWLERSFTRLRENIEAGKLAHALLLDAVPGWGVSVLAKRVNQEILGLPSNIDPETSLDYLHVDLVERSTRISIEQIREATEFLGATVRTAPRRLVTVAQADKLSIPASHALLKILEEPPTNSHLLLVTTSFSTLLPTIRSRCQRATVSQGSREEVESFLASADVDRDLLTSFLADYGGAPYAALKAIEEEQISLTEKLSQTVRMQTPVTTIAEQLRGQSAAYIDDLLIRWQYIALRVARNATQLGPVANFYDDLSDIRRQFSEVPGLDRHRQILRLLIKWRDLINQHYRRPRQRQRV